MAKGRGRGRGRGGRQLNTLTAMNIQPLLKRTSEALGKYISVPGRYWDGCAAADKNKIYKCIVVEFAALHDFGRGGKRPAFLVKEMGESGTGSLEPGVASGTEFYMTYPSPFLQYYYEANPIEGAERSSSAAYEDNEIVIEDAMLGDGDVNDDAIEAHAEAAGVPLSKRPMRSTAAGNQDSIKKKQKVATEKFLIYEYIAKVSSELNLSGPARGSYTNKYVCRVELETGQKCGGSITLYQRGEGLAEVTSNAFTHMRQRAEAGCGAHKAALRKLDETNAKRVLVNGEYMTVHSFPEAFKHHVDYVYCRARGIFGAGMGTKPTFRDYVRGYEPRAVFPHPDTQFRIAVCIHELQQEEQQRRLRRLIVEFKNNPVPVGFFEACAVLQDLEGEDHIDSEPERNRKIAATVDSRSGASLGPF
ncbi:hypothetical protein AB1Y20_013626 [Prymnesium parvum]|uniref:Uncharacterized protein n=1 Tax=Prymnesium parvum TaxID=97485 RepID=A0AB34IG48_PRYPA